MVPENIPLNIVFEDEHLLVVNKEAGMVVHPAYQNWSGTLVNALAYHFEQLPEMKGNTGRPGLVHRIDKDTSGLLVIAKRFYYGELEEDARNDRVYLPLRWLREAGIDPDVLIADPHFFFFSLLVFFPHKGLL